MKTSKFLLVLEQNPDKELIFELQPGVHIPISYHITEIKNVHIQSVDCGGRPDEYFKTVVQLWVDPKEKADRYMETGKAKQIFEKVDNIYPIRKDTEIFFEWGDNKLATSNYVVDQIKVQESNLLVKLSVPPTACKPRQDLIKLSTKISNIAGCCS